MNHRITEQPHDSHFINPTYDTTARPITTSQSNQQTTPIGRSGTNPSRGEGDTAGPLNHVLEGPLPRGEGDTAGPLYHVLEGPLSRGEGDTAGPLYHVLEGPLSRGEGDTAGPLYHVLEGPLPVESVDHTHQLLGREEEGQDYDVVSEDIVGISYKVPITTRNRTEQFEEEHQENDQDYSMVNDFTMERRSYKIPVQAVKVGQSQEEPKEEVNGRQT